MTEIKELILKIPGLSPEEGKTLGAEVAEKVAARLPEVLQNRSIETLNLRLSFAPNTSRSGMSEAIANQIIKELQLKYL